LKNLVTFLKGDTRFRNGPNGILRGLNKKEKLNLTREAEQDLSSWNKGHQLNVTKAAEQDQKN
jgi:hypothetical protein